MAQPTKIPNEKNKTPRICLRCNKEFYSVFPKSVNRRCPKCEEKVANSQSLQKEIVVPKNITISSDI